MSLVHGEDAAYARNITAWAVVVGGYLDSPWAFHAWSADDWQRFPSKPKFPYWLATPDALVDAEQIISQMSALGIPLGCPVGLDMQTRVDPLYVHEVFSKVRSHGYRMLVYGSSGTVFGNPECNGYVVASPTGFPHMYAHPGVMATQYAFNLPPGFDANLWREYVTDEMWK